MRPGEVIIGVDPGLRGAMARLSSESAIVEPIPIIPATVRNGKKLGRDQYDLGAISNVLLEWGSASDYELKTWGASAGPPALRPESRELETPLERTEAGELTREEHDRRVKKAMGFKLEAPPPPGWTRVESVGPHWVRPGPSIRTDVFVFVEQSIPLPPKLKAGSLAQFQRGVCRGWAWMLTAMGVPFELIHPKTWQAAMHRDLPGSDLKQKSILAASRLFPGVDLRRTERSRKADDGIAEALLIAEYGRRRRAGLDKPEA